jgi:hypothetical protein
VTYRHRKPLHVDLIVFVACCLIGLFYLGFEVGRQYQPKTCAKVLGMQVVSSTADTCWYILGTQGKAHWKLLAKQEEKK